MIWLTLLAAGEQATFAPVGVRNVGSLLSSDDYPFRANGTGKSGLSGVDILVDPGGKPLTCSVVVSSGSEDLDVHACAAAIRRGSFTPAVDETGRPMHGVYRLQVRWQLPDGDQKTTPPDVTLEVSKLPEDRRRPTVFLGYLVDEQGRITRCAVLESSKLPAYDAAACAAMPERYRFAPARDKAGKAWPVVRTQIVGFQVAQASSPPQATQ
jgi:TonB family protein